MMANRPATREQQWDSFPLETFVKRMGEFGEHGVK